MAGWQEDVLHDEMRCGRVHSASSRDPVADAIRNDLGFVAWLEITLRQTRYNVHYTALHGHAIGVTLPRKSSKEKIFSYPSKSRLGLARTQQRHARSSPRLSITVANRELTAPRTASSPYKGPLVPVGNTLVVLSQVVSRRRLPKCPKFGKLQAHEIVRLGWLLSGITEKR